MTPDVVGIGQCAFDILGQIDTYPQVDEKTELHDIDLQGGGPVATALVTLSRLGLSTAFVGRAGDDGFGRRIQGGLETEGVDCRYLELVENARSQLAFIAIEKKSARRTIFWHRGSAPPLSSTEIDRELIRRCRLLHLDGLQSEAAFAAASTAREAGVTTVLDGGTLRPGVGKLLPLIDHLVVSEKFARQVEPSGKIIATLRALLQWGAQAVTVTLGESGSYTQVRGEEPFHQPSFKVDAVDTTGCGDVFHGGYIFALLQGWPLPKGVAFAAACAALKARAVGGRRGIAPVSEVVDFLRTRNVCGF